MRSLLAVSLLLGLLFTGCATTSESPPGQTKSVLGIVTVEENAYTPTGPNTVEVSSSDVVPDQNRTGRKVTLLWGLITYTDY